MKWSLQQLSRYHNEYLEFSDSANYDEYVKNFGDIIRLDEVKYEGRCIAVSDDLFKFNLHITANMVLEDSRTLEEIDFPIDLDVEEVFTKDERLISDDNDYRYIEKNTIDLYDVVWENIILEKPISITKEN